MEYFLVGFKIAWGLFTGALVYIALAAIIIDIVVYVKDWWRRRRE